MASRYHLADEAHRDLDEIWLFIARDNPTAADAVIDACYLEFTGLVSQPGLGHRRPDTPGDCLSKVVAHYQNYVIIYRVRAEVLEIARVLHGSMDFERQFPG